MINMYITVPTRTSTAIDSLQVDLLARKAYVTFVNGYEYEYTNVSARAIAQVLFNPDISLGFWVNNNLVNTERTQIANDEYQELANRFTKLDNKLEGDLRAKRNKLDAYLKEDKVSLPEFA